MRLKHCVSCKKDKRFDNFYSNSAGIDGMSTYCKSCEYLTTLKYKRSKKGMITTAYRTQVNNSYKRGHENPKYTRLELFTWLMSQPKFHKLYDAWVLSNYIRDLRPSVDRKNPAKGYSIGNIQVLTWKENVEKSHNNRRMGINFKGAKEVIQMSLDGSVEICRYKTITLAAKKYGVNHTAISNACKGVSKHSCGYKWKFADNK